MGKLIQIRVTARTWDSDAVCRAWPRLCATAEPASKTEATSNALQEVLALPRVLRDSLQFGPWSKAYVQALREGVEQACDLVKKLENALADWDASRANALSEELEKSLDALERVAQDAPDAPAPYTP